MGVGGGGGSGTALCDDFYKKKQTNKQISVLTCPPLEVKMPLKLQTDRENINVVQITCIKNVSKCSSSFDKALHREGRDKYKKRYLFVSTKLSASTLQKLQPSCQSFLWG